jgi:hypothetical protein
LKLAALDGGIAPPTFPLYAWRKAWERTMLVSEILGWQWVVTWDNPQDYDAIIRAFEALGRADKLATATTILFAPRSDVGEDQVRATIVEHMKPDTGHVVYVNLETKAAHEWKDGAWHKVV